MTAKEFAERYGMTHNEAQKHLSILNQYLGEEVSSFKDKNGTIHGGNKIGSKILAGVLGVCLTYFAAGEVIPVFNKTAIAAGARPNDYKYKFPHPNPEVLLPLVNVVVRGDEIDYDDITEIDFEGGTFTDKKGEVFEFKNIEGIEGNILNEPFFKAVYEGEVILGNDIGASSEAMPASFQTLADDEVEELVPLVDMDDEEVHIDFEAIILANQQAAQNEYTFDEMIGEPTNKSLTQPRVTAGKVSIPNDVNCPVYSYPVDDNEKYARAEYIYQNYIALYPRLMQHYSVQNIIDAMTLYTAGNTEPITYDIAYQFEKMMLEIMTAESDAVVNALNGITHYPNNFNPFNFAIFLPDNIDGIEITREIMEYRTGMMLSKSRKQALPFAQDFTMLMFFGFSNNGAGNNIYAENSDLQNKGVQAFNHILLMASTTLAGAVKDVPIVVADTVHGACRVTLHEIENNINSNQCIVDENYNVISQNNIDLVSQINGNISSLRLGGNQ